jgi:glycosyltransferase involved in cell wall biosynthesis
MNRNEKDSDKNLTSVKVLYLDHTSRLSGGEMALFRLITNLDRSLVHPVVIIAEEGALAEKLRAAGVETHILPLLSALRTARKDKLGLLGTLSRVSQLTPFLKYAKEIACFAQLNNIELIYTNSLKSDFYGALAGRLAKVPVIWHVRDRIEESYLPLSAVRMVRLLARRLPVCVVANSVSTLETLQLPKDKPTEVISSGLTQEYIQRCRAPRCESPVPQIGIVGRIAPWKGQDVFLRAAAQVLKAGHKAHFRIIGAPLFGEDDVLGQLEALVCDLGIKESVSFLGFQEDIPAQLRSLDMLVHASVTPEPFGQVIVEGMVAGLPVIATNGGGAREIVTHQETGLLVPLGDVDALAASMIELLENTELAQRLAAAGREHALATYTIELSARKSEALYHQVLKRVRTGMREPWEGSKHTLSFLLSLVLAECLAPANLQIFK